MTVPSDNDPFLSTPNPTAHPGEAEPAPPNTSHVVAEGASVPEEASPDLVLDVLLARIASLEAQLGEETATSKALRGDVTSERDARKLVELTLGKKLTESRKKLGDMSGLERKVAQLEGTLAERLTDLTAAEAELSGLKAKIKDLEKDARVHDATAWKLRDLLAEERKYRETAEANIEKGTAQELSSLKKKVKELHNSTSEAHTLAMLAQVDLATAKDDLEKMTIKYQHQVNARDVAYRGFLRESRLRKADNIRSEDEDNDENNRIQYPSLIAARNRRVQEPSSPSENEEDSESGWIYDPTPFMGSISAPIPPTKLAPDVKKPSIGKHQRNLATDITSSKRVGGGDKISAPKVTKTICKRSAFLTPLATYDVAGPSSLRRPVGQHEVIEISDDSDYDERTSALKTTRSVTPTLKRTQIQAQVTPTATRRTRARVVNDREEPPPTMAPMLSGEIIAKMAVALAAAPGDRVTPSISRQASIKRLKSRRIVANPASSSSVASSSISDSENVPSAARSGPVMGANTDATAPGKTGKSQTTKRRG